MIYAFVSGIPASGKSYLAARVAQKVGAQHIEMDALREEMKDDSELKKWVDFFWNKDEAKYWEKTNCDEHWLNLKNQSEAFWPTLLKRIKKVQQTGKSAIFDGVNLLPHLTRKDFDFSGIILLGDSFESIFERNKKAPRWGQTEALQSKEAKAFYTCERPKYEAEAEKWGYLAFSDMEKAEKELLGMFSG